MCAWSITLTLWWLNLNTENDFRLFTIFFTFYRSNNHFTLLLKAGFTVDLRSGVLDTHCLLSEFVIECLQTFVCVIKLPLSLLWKDQRKLSYSSKGSLCWTALLISLHRLTGSVATAKHFWISPSNVVFRTRCSSGMGFFMIFSAGMDCRGWRVR